MLEPFAIVPLIVGVLVLSKSGIVKWLMVAWNAVLNIYRNISTFYKQFFSVGGSLGELVIFIVVFGCLAFLGFTIAAALLAFTLIVGTVYPFPWLVALVTDHYPWVFGKWKKVGESEYAQYKDSMIDFLKENNDKFIQVYDANVKEICSGKFTLDETREAIQLDFLFLPEWLRLGRGPIVKLWVNLRYCSRISTMLFPANENAPIEFDRMWNITR